MREKQKRRKTKSLRGKGEKERIEEEERASHALSDFWCSDSQKSIGRELKLFYLTKLRIGANNIKR